MVVCIIFDSCFLEKLAVIFGTVNLFPIHPRGPFYTRRQKEYIFSISHFFPEFTFVQIYKKVCHVQMIPKAGKRGHQKTPIKILIRSCIFPLFFFFDSRPQKWKRTTSLISLPDIFLVENELLCVRSSHIIWGVSCSFFVYLLLLFCCCPCLLLSCHH